MISASELGLVNVHTTSGRGLSAEEYAQLASKRILHVSDSVPGPIRAQAHAFQKEIEKAIEHYIKKAIRSDRTTVYNALVEAGHPDLAKAILEV